MLIVCFMAKSTPPNTADPGLEVTTFYVHARNTLLARADLGAMYVDYYLHHSDQGIHYLETRDTLFKRGLAGFVLHCASRPWNEMTAWTLHFEELHLNLFLTGDNETGSVTGRLFEENIKEMDGNYFFSEVVRADQPKRRSVAKFTGTDPLVAIETFYRMSEQRGVRVFQEAEEVFSMLSEHPDCDMEWFSSVAMEEVKALVDTQSGKQLEKRVYRWHCGCNEARILEVLAPLFRDDAKALFHEDPSIEIRCPRCAARYAVTRERMEAYLASGGKEG